MKIIILYGNEPYLVDYHKRKNIGTFQCKELNFKAFDGFKEEVVAFLSTFPVMDERKCALVSVNDLKELNTAAFKKLTATGADYATLIVTCSQADARTTFYKEMVKNEWLLLCNKYSDITKVAAVLRKEVERLNATISEEALNLFLRKTNYMELSEVDLYFLVNEMRKVAAYDANITVETVTLLVKDNIAENIFGIVRLLQKKDIAGLRAQAELLSDNPIGTLSALLREFRIGYKSKYYPLKEIGVNYCSLKDRNKDYLVQGIDIIIDAIDGIKNGSVPEKNVLEYVFFKLLVLEGGRV